MNGLITAVVLGAGASYCYEDGLAPIPMQNGLLERLFFGADTSSGEGFPSFVGPTGPQHSYVLGRLLRKKFGIPEDSTRPNAKMDFWPELHRRGYTLETLYAELEADAEATALGVLPDFEAIVRTAVETPTKDRSESAVCRHHRALCEALEPGDYIVNFNWDTLMADALLRHSHFWFPLTGFGVPVLGTLLRPSQKSHNVPSLVTLLHVHGSVILFEPEDTRLSRGSLYVGPQQWSATTGLPSLLGVDPRSKGSGSAPLASQDDEKLGQGWVIVDKKWFRPLFVPPSRYTKELDHWYVSATRIYLHSRLPGTKHFIIAGYSFPPADTEHLRRLFVPDVLRPDLRLSVINPSNQDAAFQSRV